MKLILCALLILSSCSFKKSQLENQTRDGHQELYSEPESPKLEKLEENERRLILAATNDLHGNMPGEEFSVSDRDKTQKIRIGGQQLIADYFRILREQYKTVVLVDSGDIFSKAEEMGAVRSFYETNGYDALTVGLRDFNLKVPPELKSNTGMFQKFAKENQVPLLLSNLYELKTARVVEWPGTKPYLLKEVDGVKVGIIGLIPDDIVSQTPVNNRVGLYVENMLQSTLRHARLLRSLGADAIVVLTHQGIDCVTELAEEAKLPLSKVNFEPARQGACDLRSMLGEYLLRLPHGLVDVVVGGRNHLKMANTINGTIVLGGFSDGRSFSYAELVVNVKTHRLNPKKSVVHQPVYFCAEFFQETTDCYFEDPSVDHQKRIPATFLGKKIVADKTAAAKKESPVRKISLEGLEHLEADLGYLPQTSGETQLVMVKLKGRELLKLLEGDFNQGSAGLWQPSPFALKGNTLTVTVRGEPVDPERDYRVLGDLEGLQRNHVLKKKIPGPDAVALMDLSWASVEEKLISVSLSAPTRQRQ